MMTDAASREKLAPTRDKTSQVEAEHAAFANAAVPIDQAMAQLGKSRPEAITPQASDDVSAVTGWSRLPKPAPVPHKGEPAAAAGDAGATTAAQSRRTARAGRVSARRPRCTA